MYVFGRVALIMRSNFDQICLFFLFLNFWAGFTDFSNRKEAFWGNKTWFLSENLSKSQIKKISKIPRATFTRTYFLNKKKACRIFFSIFLQKKRYMIRDSIYSLIWRYFFLEKRIRTKWEKGIHKTESISLN